MPTITDLLSVSNLTEIAPAIEDVRTLPGQFRALSRLPIRPAEDADIMARVSGREVAGDVLPDGGIAIAKTSPPITLEQVSIANFKREVVIPPTQLALLARILRNGGSDDLALSSFSAFVGDVVRRNRLGNMQRMEQMAWGMFFDSYTYSYDGQKFALTWGKPNDLKPGVLTAWSNPAAKPITDLATLIVVGDDKYSVSYDRLELRLVDFLNAIATNEFQNYAKAKLAVNYLPPAVNSPDNRAIFAGLLGIDEVAVFERSLDEEAMDASVSSTKFIPANKVLLSRKSDDDNTATWKFGNAVVLESMVAEATGAREVIGGTPTMQAGPFTWAEAGPKLSNISINEVVRGLPMTNNPAATAVLNVG